MDKRDNGIENTTTDVGVQHRLDASVHSSSVRRPSSSHSISEDDLDQDAPFVRKRAYVSVHQAVEPEQPGMFSALYSPRLCSSPLPPVSGQCASSSSCQLLLAAPQRTLSTNSHTVNPKITHLPHRRSSRSIPANSVKSRTSNQMKQSALPGVHYTASATPASIDCSPVVENAAMHPPVATSEVSSLLTHRSGNDASFESGKLPDPALPDGHIFPRRAKSHNKCVVRAALGDILCSSFNSDPNDSNEALWCKAGDAYRAIAFADGEITRRLAEHKERQLHAEGFDRQDLSEAMHDLYLNINKENKIDNTWRPYISSETWSSPATGSNCYPSFSLQTSYASSGLCTSYKEAPSHGPHIRALRSGPLPRRSDMNIRRDLSGSFLSRQCLCKILSLEGSVGKTYSWKPYYMSITDKEVRFIKASSAAYGISRSNKLSKLSNQILAPQNPDSFRAKDESHVFGSCDDMKVSQSPVPLHPGLANSSAGRTYQPKDYLFASYLILPIIGLMWNSEELPVDLPQWQPLGQVPVTHNQSIVPDHMDPSLSGLSRSHDPTRVDDPLRSCPLIDPSHGSTDTTRSCLKCFRFIHLDAGVELLFVFPDESVALTCLNLCQLYGGQSIHRTDAAELHLTEHSATGTPRRVDSSHPLLKISSGLTDCKPCDRGKILESTDLIVRKEHSASTQANEEKFPVSSRSIGGKTFFMQSIRQFLNRSTGGHNATVSDDSAPPASLPSDVESKLAAILGDPPDFCDLESPGPVFGSPLEAQLESPDYPFVPVLLQCFVTSLEFHGISLLGLYRKPGRQRSISQFVCVSNLVPKNVDLLLTLDAWREPYAICGLLKYFLRRLPSRLLDLASWEPLALLAPDKDSPLDVARLAYLLLSTRVKLWKMANEAYGDPVGCFIPLASIDHRGNDERNPSKAAVCTQADRWHASAKWRWATLLYVVEHLRNVVSHETENEVTYQCAAICFGPVLFDDSIHVDKLNVVLENVLKHWRWLIQGLPIAEPSDLSPSSFPRIQTHEWNLSEAVNYLRMFELNETKSRPRLNDYHINTSHADFSITSGVPAHQAEGVASFRDDFHGLRQMMKSLLNRALEKAEISNTGESLRPCRLSSPHNTPFSVPHTSVERTGTGRLTDRCISPTSYSCSQSPKQDVNGASMPSVSFAPSRLSKPTFAMHYTNELHHPIKPSAVPFLSDATTKRLPRSSSYNF